MSQPSYKTRITTTFAVDLMTQQVGRTDHAFWPDDVSLRDVNLFDPACIFGPKQITDVYLLALAMRNGGRLVTFDQSVPLAAVRGAEPRHLVVLMTPAP